MTNNIDLYAQLEQFAAVNNAPPEFLRELTTFIARQRAASLGSPPAVGAIDAAAVLAGLRELRLPASALVSRVRAEHLLDLGVGVAFGVGEMVLEYGEPVIAYDIVQDGRRRYPTDVGLRQLEALALARSGATARADEILKKINYDGNQDANTFALMGGVHRDWGIREADKRKAETYFREARSFYERAFKKDSRDWYLARAAVMAFRSNDKASARDFAVDLLTRCNERLKHTEKGSRFWPLAMAGEAHLILGDERSARDSYAQAMQHVGSRLGDLASARRHARLLFDHQGKVWDEANSILKMPPVAVFVGHMVDPAHGTISGTGRFPAELEDIVRREIRDKLRQLGVKVGYASAACGSDILFHEVLQQDLEGESHVILPCHPDLFVERSVRPGGSTWPERFQRVLKGGNVVCLGDQLVDYKALSFTYGNMVLHGLAAMKARQLDAALKFVAVWDNQPGQGPGGTADNVKRWRAGGQKVEVIDIADLRARHLGATRVGLVPPTSPAPGAKATAVAAAARRTRSRSRLKEPASAELKYSAVIAGVLFADVAGFSKLTEVQLLKFVELFLGTVAELVRDSKLKPLKKNTWGDGLFFVFNSVLTTGRFALDLSERVADRRADWARQGLPPEIDLRTGVHAGPVFTCTDPVTARPNCIGMHVSRTARIEPITPEGQVYASQEFAALAEAEGIEEFECNYVGQTEFAKKYGTFPTYHLRRRT